MNLAQYTKTGPLSFQQLQGYKYFTTVGDAGESHSILDAQLTLDKVDLSAFYNTIHYLYTNNCSLRSSIIKVDGEENAVQKINSLADLDKYIDIVQLPNINNINIMDSDPVRKAKKQIGFGDILLLSKVILFKDDNNMSKCLILLHHIISDQWSVSTLENEFNTIYHNFTSGTDTKQENSSPYTMIDYAIGQYQYFEDNKTKLISYWKNILSCKVKTLSPFMLKHFSLLKEEPDRLSSNSDLQNILNNEECDYYISIYEGKVFEDINNIIEKTNVGFLAFAIGLFNLIPSYKRHNNSLLIASPTRDFFNKKAINLVGPCTGAIYSYPQLKYDNHTYKTYFSFNYLSLLRSIRYLVTEHSFFNLDGRLLRLNTDIYMNVFPRSFNVKLKKEHYTGEAFKNQRTFYALECSIYEQENNVCIIWGYNKGIYSSDIIKQLSDLITSIISEINQNINAPIVVKS